MFRWLKRLVNYIRLRNVAKQIDKRVLKEMIETQHFLDSHCRSCRSYWEELKSALQE